MIGFFESVFGPIFAKEMVLQARKWRFFLTRMLIAAGLLFILWILFENGPWRYSRSPFPREMARFAEDMYATCRVAIFLFTVLFVPILCCGLISNERERTTLELLLTTELMPREIVFGKLMSRMATVVVIIFCSFPVFSFIMLFGGIDPERLFFDSLITLLCALLVGSVSVYFSTITKSFLGSMIRTYFWLILVYVLIPLALMLFWESTLGRRGRGGTPYFVEYYVGLVLGLDPFALFIVNTNATILQNIINFAGFNPIPYCFIGPTLTCVALITLACRAVRKEPKPLTIQFSKLLHYVPFYTRVQQALAARWKFRKSQLQNAVAKLRKRDPRVPTETPIAKVQKPVNNPFWQRSRLAKVFDREGYIQRVQTAGWWIVGISMFLVALDNRRDLFNGDTSPGFLGITWFVILMLIVLVSGSSVVGDRRRGFLEQVLITPITGKELIDGTFMAVVEHLRTVFKLLIVLQLFFTINGSMNLDATFFSFTSGVLYLILLMYVGILFSLTAESDINALVATLCFPIFGLIGPFPIAMVMEERHMYVLWPLVCLLFVYANLAVTRRKTLRTVFLFALSWYLGLGCLFSSWTIESMNNLDRGFPVLAMNQFYLVGFPLERFNIRSKHAVNFGMIAWTNWLAMSITIIYLRFWMIRHFAALVGRIEGDYAPESTEKIAPWNPGQPRTDPLKS